MKKVAVTDELLDYLGTVYENMDENFKCAYEDFDDFFSTWLAHTELAIQSYDDMFVD